jgi:hypothetical protein
MYNVWFSHIFADVKGTQKELLTAYLVLKK